MSRGPGVGRAAPPVEHEADAAHRADQRRVTELSAQVGDVAVDDVRLRLQLAAPDLLQRLLARDDRARVAQQQLQQRALARGRLEVAAGAVALAAGEVERHVGEGEQLRHRAAAPQQRAQAGAQLLAGERLDEVVVGAGVEPGDAVGRPRRAR